jgi:hypothetical protein
MQRRVPLEVFKIAFDGPDPLLRHVRTQVRSPHTNGVIQRWLSTLKYEHLFRGVITDGDALDMEVYRFRIIYNTIEHPARPTQVVTSRNRSMSGRSRRTEARRFSARYHPRGRPRRGSQHVGEGPRQHLVDQWGRQLAERATSRYIAVVECGQRPLSVGLEREGGLGVLETRFGNRVAGSVALDVGEQYRTDDRLDTGGPAPHQERLPIFAKRPLFDLLLPAQKTSKNRPAAERQANRAVEE